MLRRSLYSVLVLVILAGVFTAANWIFVSRYVSFAAGGYDPKTVPLDWYTPIVAIKGGSGAPMPMRDESARTIPAPVLDEILAYANDLDSQALIIARGGEIELERYWGDASRDTMFNPQSMSKTVLALLVGIAIKNGDIPAVSESIATYMPEFTEDPRGAITIEHLLQMSAGLEQMAKDYSPVPWSRGVRQFFGTSFNKWLLDLDLIDTPGTEFEYNNSENNLLGWVLERATKTAYPTYLSEQLWQPLNLGDAFMYLDKTGGDTMKSCCIFSRPLDWLALGQLFLDRGRVEGEQVVPAAWLDAMVEPTATFSGYGYQIWLAPTTLRGGTIGETPPASPYLWWASEPFAGTVYMFLGFGFHHVWVMPDIDTVVVRAASQRWPTQPWDQSRIPNALLRGLLVDGR